MFGISRQQLGEALQVLKTELDGNSSQAYVHLQREVVLAREGAAQGLEQARTSLREELKGVEQVLTTSLKSDQEAMRAELAAFHPAAAVHKAAQEYFARFGLRPVQDVSLDELTQEEKNLERDRKHRLACQCKIKKGKITINF